MTIGTATVARTAPALAAPGTALAAPAALAGTALFLLHPLQSESVLYIWGRSEILSTLFGLLAILLALAADDRKPAPGTGRRYTDLTERLQQARARTVAAVSRPWDGQLQRVPVEPEKRTRDRVRPAGRSG